MPEAADVVIVGGGLAGLEVAKELGRLGVRDVVVVEAGPADDLAHVNAVHDPDTALRLWAEPASDEHFWRPWSSRSAPHYDGVAGLRRRLGGRSLYWHGVLLPLEHWALTPEWWPASVLSDLTEAWQGGPSLYERVRADLDTWQGNGDRPSRQLPVGPYRLTTTPQAIRGDAKSWQAYSPAEHWANGSRPARVVPGTEVLGVRVANGRVNGVVAGDGEIACQAVVLAAGTIESTRLAVQALSAAGAIEGTTIDGLTDHLVQGFVAPLDPRTLPAELVELAASEPFFVTPLAEARSNLFVRLYPNAAGALVVDVWAMGEQLPSAENTVECVPALDRDRPWQVFVKAGLTAADHDVLGAQRRELRGFWNEFLAMTGRAGSGQASSLAFGDFLRPSRTLHDVVPGIGELPAGSDPLTWSSPLGSEYHEASTLGLGRVLTDRHEFPAIKGLYAAGPATFARPGAANPSLTILALARRLATELVRR